jgi:hypothetical protein
MATLVFLSGVNREKPSTEESNNAALAMAVLFKNSWRDIVFMTIVF